jgi:hypothetical protein
MFEGIEVGADDAPWWLDDDDATEPGHLPPVPVGLLVVSDAEDAWGALAFEAELAALPAVERWAYQYGTSAVPSPAVILGDTSEAAAYAQELAVQATQIRTIADAHRISALLTAFERSMEDLQLRFGSIVGNPRSPGRCTPRRCSATGSRPPGRCSRPGTRRGRGCRPRPARPTGSTRSTGPATTPPPPAWW